MVSSLVRPGVHLPALCGVARGEGGEGDERDGHDQAWRISLPCSCKYPVVNPSGMTCVLARPGWSHSTQWEPQEHRT